MEKNTAGKWIVFAYGLPDHASDGQAITGDAANITANVRIDGGAANAVDDVNPTELEDGYYVFDITAAEANGDLISIHPASSTANVQVIGVPGAVWTRPANFNDLSVTATTGRVDVAAVAGTSQTANDNGADINLILADTAELQADWANAGRLDAILDTIAADVVNIDGIVPAAAGDAMTLAAGAVTNASLAENMEIVFETDFATNYNQTDNGWVTNGTSFIGTGWNTGKTGYTLTATTGLGDQTADITGNLSGSVGSVTGAVGSVTGAVGSVTGHTNQTGDTYALANGAGGFSDINTDVEAIKVITDALTSAGAANLALSAAGIIGGATSGTPTTVASDTDLTGYADDELIGRTIIFTGGTADGQASDITDYASTNGVVTYTAITTAPAASDTFVIV